MEYALNFDGAHINKQNEVNVVQCPTQPHKEEYQAVDQLSKLQSSITEMTKRMEARSRMLQHWKCEDKLKFRQWEVDVQLQGIENAIDELVFDAAKVT